MTSPEPTPHPAKESRVTPEPSNRSAPDPGAYGRPLEGRWVSGTALWAAETCGVSLVLARVGFVLLALGGLALATAVLIFDTALFGAPLSDPARITFAGLGGLGILAYPMLSLLLPSRARSHWDFGSVVGALLLLTFLGHGIGALIQPYWEFAKAARQGGGASAWLRWPAAYQSEVGFGARGFAILLFVAATLPLVWMLRRELPKFFRSMYVGVSLVTLSLLAIGLGVLVPQIDGFEDPTARVDMEAEYRDFQAFQRDGYQKLPASLQDGHEQYQAFRWAEGYFLYHLLHLYGIGMPKEGLTPRMQEGLEVFGKKYGLEERDNREKQMLAAFSGREKVNEIGAFIHRNEPAFWRFFQLSTALEWNRTYKSAWFTALMTLLFTAIAFNTFKGKPRQWFSIHKFGYFTVHTGMMILLLGGFWSKLHTDRGILHLHLDMPPQDTYWGHYDPAKERSMPFALGLDHFARQDWPSLEVQFLDDEAQSLTSRPPTHTLWKGRPIELDLVDDGAGGLRPRVRIEVVDLSDRAQVRRPVVRELGAGQPGGLALAALVVADAGREREVYLPAVAYDLSPPIYDADHSFRLVAMNAGVAPGGDEMQDDPLQWFPSLPGYVGGLEVRVVGAGDGAPHTLAATLGQTTELPGGYSMTVVDATADLDVKRDKRRSAHPLPLEEQPLRGPAVWLDLVGPDGREERRAVVQGISAKDLGAQASFTLAEIEVRFDWDEWGAPGAPRYLLWWSDAGCELIAETGERTPVELGTELPLPGNMVVRPSATYESATFVADVTLLPPVEAVDGWDADFYHRGARGVVLEVTLDPGTAAATTHVVPMASTDEFNADRWVAPDSSFVMRFFENDRMLPFEWRSVLQVYEQEDSGGWKPVDLGPEPAREIRVNDYFKYKGYRFFQTNANPEDPAYSGIGVVYDPGIPIVLVGMYTVIAGTVITFLIRPIVLARRERRKLATLARKPAKAAAETTA
ncbi:MAG: hypothetical protein WD226_10195 [Planctomycetota bacterium]